MKIKLLLLFLLVSVFYPIKAQENLSNYSYIVVPTKFDFLDEPDKYQLNSIAKFLFNKHGFNAFFEEELPDVRRCDGLYAEVIGVPNFIWTKVTVVIKDCYGTELFRTMEGRSKLKAFKDTYNEAMRMAFESFAGLGVKQPPVGSEVVKNTEIKEKEGSPSNSLNFPKAKYSNYSKDGTSYLLQKTNEGYSLYQETLKAQDGLQYEGKLFVVEGVLFFEDVSEERFIASFDADGSLKIVNDKGAPTVYQRNN